MASARSATAFRHLLDVFESGSLVGLDDADLLARYARSLDPSAFEALVLRHGPMILATCRAVLHHDHDVEDAFQATFLVLARRAASIRNPHTLGPWLHRVAYRASLQLRKAQKRRRQKETEAASMNPPTTPPTNPEHLARLHDEINRLPDRHRLPIILCDLEGLTYEQAANRLLWTVPTLRTRLAKARQTLKTRLLRRGIPVVALGILTAPPRASAALASAAVPASLVRSVVSAASGGTATTGASILAHTLIRGMFMTKLSLISTVALSTATLISATVLTLASAHPEAPKPNTQPQTASTTPRPTPKADKPADTVEIRGIVLNPDGQPVSGAEVVVERFRVAGASGLHADFRGRDELAHAKTGADGRYRLSFELVIPDASERPDSPNHRQQVVLSATADGFAPAIGDGPVAPEQTLRLARDDVPITGRVIDLEGRPVAGATVRIHEFYMPPGPDAVTAFVTGPIPFPIITGSHIVPGRSSALPKPVKTDSDGRFRLSGIGRDRQVILDVSGPDLAFRRFNVITRPMDRIEGRQTRNLAGLDDPAIYGADCTLIAAPSRAIEGTVRDADTGAPIPGAIVTSMQLPGSTLDIEGILSATTDAKGHYRLEGLPKGDGHKLKVYPPAGQPYFIHDFLKVPASPGLGPVSFDITLKRGIMITGRVTDALSGKPVRAAVGYLPFLSNNHARDYPNFDSRVTSLLDPTGVRYLTDANGRYQVPGLPGRGLIVVKALDRAYRVGVGADAIAGRDDQVWLLTYNRADPHLYHALKEINPPPDADEGHCELALDPGQSLRLRLVNPAGASVAIHCAVDGRFPRRLDVGNSSIYEDGPVEIVGLSPDETRAVLVKDYDDQLSAVRIIRPDDPDLGGTSDLVLRPFASAKGRLVDAKGQPVTTGGVEAVLVVPGTEDVNPRVADKRVASVKVDADGRFTLEGFKGLPPGGTYRLRARDPLDYGLPEKPSHYEEFTLTDTLTPGPGAVIDLGTFDVSTGKRVEKAGKERDPVDGLSEKAAPGEYKDLGDFERKPPKRVEP